MFVLVGFFSMPSITYQIRPKATVSTAGALLHILLVYRILNTYYVPQKGPLLKHGSNVREPEPITIPLNHLL